MNEAPEIITAIKSELKTLRGKSSASLGYEEHEGSFHNFFNQIKEDELEKQDIILLRVRFKESK